MKVVFYWSFGCNRIWLYYKNASMNERSSWQTVTSTKRSMCGNGKLSLGHALVRLVKSMHTLHFPFVFLIMMTFASQSRQRTSLIKYVSISLHTSSFTIWLYLIMSLHPLYFTGLWFGLMLSQWRITVRLMPGMSLHDHTKQSQLSTRNLTNWLHNPSSSNEPALTHRLSFSESIWISSNCSTSNYKQLINPFSACNCYKRLSNFNFMDLKW